MANGYCWWPVWKETTIPGGVVSLYDLRTQFPEAAGPIRVDLSYKQVERTREDVNHADQRLVFGFRPQIRLTFALVDLTYGGSFLSQMVSRSIDRANYKCELSLDHGVTFREVVLASPPNLKPRSAKTVAGLDVEVAFSGKDLLTTYPGMVPTVLDRAFNGGFESWGADAYGPIPSGYKRERIGAPSSGVFTDITADVYAGGHSCQVYSYPGEDILHQHFTGLVAGAWYKASVWVHSAIGVGTITNGLIFAPIQHTPNIRYLRAGTATGVFDPATATWGVFESWNPYKRTCYETAWTQLELWVPMPLNIDGVPFTTANDVSMALWLDTPSVTMRWDQFKFEGPYPPQGVAAW